MALEVGPRLGHYEVTALIGEGGMGQIYWAGVCIRPGRNQAPRRTIADRSTIIARFANALVAVAVLAPWPLAAQPRQPAVGAVVGACDRWNWRGAHIGAEWDPHWHQPTDRYATFSDDDFRLGLNAGQTTLAATAQLVGARIVE